MKQLLIRRVESKMKEFDTNFVESLLDGVKAKVKSIGDNGVYALWATKYLSHNNKKKPIVWIGYI